MNEAELKDNIGLGDNPEQYMAEIRRRHREENPDFRPDPSTMRNISQLHKIQSEGNNKERLLSLAEEIIRTEFSDVIEAMNINLDMKIVDFRSEDIGDLSRKMSDDPKKARDKAEREEELKGLEDDGDNEEKPIEIKSGEEMASDVTLKSEVDKRKLINVIIQGAAKNVHRIIHMYRDQINDIDPQLVNLMDNILKSNETMEWFVYEDPNRARVIRGGMNGACEVEWENNSDMGKSESMGDDTADDMMKGDLENMEELPEIEGSIKVKAYAIDFPILLHETVKGIYETIGLAGIPEDAEVAKNVMIETDTLYDEVEDLVFGKYVRQDLVKFINNNPKSEQVPNCFEFVFNELIQEPAEKFLKIFKGIIFGDKDAEYWVDKAIDRVINMYNEWREGQKKTQQEIDEYSDDDYTPSDDEKSGKTIDDFLSGGHEDDVIDDEPSGEEKPKKVKPLSHYSKAELNLMLNDAIEEGDYERAQEIAAAIDRRGK